MHQAVGMYYNIKREDTCAIAQYVAGLFQARQVDVFAGDQLQAQRAGIPYLPRPEFLERITLMVVIGGDGTFLRAATIVRNAQIPLIGINQGTLGFLAELEVEEFEEKLEQLIAGNYRTEARMTICGELYRDGARICQTVGLNDVTINRDPVENTLELDVYLEEQLVDSYQADGIIIATPTGSTGYSLFCRRTAHLSRHRMSHRQSDLRPRARHQRHHRASRRRHRDPSHALQQRRLPAHRRALRHPSQAGRHCARVQGRNADAHRPARKAPVLRDRAQQTLRPQLSPNAS